MNSRLTIAIHIIGMIAWTERDRGRAATSRELAASTGTHEVFVRGILSDLGRAGLTSSLRGRNGGTGLAQPASDITLAHVYQAIRTNEPALLGGYPGSTGQSCVAAPVILDYLSEIYSDAERLLVASLATHTVEEMSKTIVQGIAARRRSTEGV